MPKNKLVTLILALVVFGLSAFGTYAFFTQTGGGGLGDDSPGSITQGKDQNDFEQLVFDQSLPKTQVCPLNGAKYSKEQEKWWKEHRPLGVMIENHEEARPQSGLEFADVIYEAVAEGGITRFLAVYYCQDAGIVGPVRSARTYFLDWISEYGENPLYAHVGGANTPGPANALGQIVDYGWNLYNDLNQFSIGFPTYRRDESRLGRPVATEHTMYSTTTKLWQVGAQRELTEVDEDGVDWDEDFVKYKFKNDASANDRGDVSNIHIEFWEGYNQYSVDWTYDPKTNMYLRENGGKPHHDRNTNHQLSAKNVVILYMRETPANDGYEGNAHRLYGNKGTGNAIVFQDGEEKEGEWEKDGRTGRTIVTVDGDEVEYNPGLIWFEIVPTFGVVEAS